MTSNTSTTPTQTDTDAVKRGPNEEPISTAQENITQGYGSSRKASIISAKPDPDGSTKGRDNKAIQGNAQS